MRMARNARRRQAARHARAARAPAGRSDGWGNLPVLHVAGRNLCGALALERKWRAATSGRRSRPQAAEDAGLLALNPGPADRHLVHPEVRLADADGYALAGLAAH